MSNKIQRVMQSRFAMNPRVIATLVGGTEKEIRTELIKMKEEGVVRQLDGDRWTKVKPKEEEPDE